MLRAHLFVYASKLTSAEGINLQKGTVYHYGSVLFFKLMSMLESHCPLNSVEYVLGTFIRVRLLSLDS